MPSIITDESAAYDDSTPKEYNPNSSGFIGYVTGENDRTTGGIITKNAKTRYNNLLKDYAFQLYENERIQVKEDDGVEHYKDIYNNDLFIIHPQHLAYFMKMNRWKKEKRPVDSVWMKLKNITN